MLVNKNTVNTAIVLVAVVLVFGVSLYAYNTLVGGTAAQAAIGQTAPANQLPASSGSSGGFNQAPTCGNQKPVAQLSAYYLDPTNNNQYTGVATTVRVCQAGVPNCITSVTSSASTVVNTAEGNISCGVTYREIAGDGGGTTYYYASTSDFVVANSVVPAPNDGKGIITVPSGAATMLVKSPTANYAATLSYNWTATNGQTNTTTDTSVYLRVQAPSAPSQFGDLGYAVCFRYSSANFTSAKILGGTQVAIAHVKPTTTLDTIQCSELPALAGGKYVEINAALKGATSGPSNATTMDVILVDKTNELYNGYLIPDENSKAGVASNGYDTVNDPNTGTGRADVTTSSAITFLR